MLGPATRSVAGHSTASPAATLVRSSPTPYPTATSMTTSQEGLGQAWGSIRAAGEGELEIHAALVAWIG